VAGECLLRRACDEVDDIRFQQGRCPHGIQTIAGPGIIDRKDRVTLTDVGQQQGTLTNAGLGGVNDSMGLSMKRYRAQRC